MAKKQRILIIDDDPGLVKMIGLILYRAGYEVEAASSGLDGLSKLDEFKPDLIILDRMMPLMDGLEVVRRIRLRSTSLHLPIIMLSALGSADDKVIGFEAGVDDYVAKPVDNKELLARVKALLIRSRLSLPQTAKTVAVCGAKGGVGATSVAVNVAITLARQGKLVVLAELRPYGGSLRFMLRVPSAQDLGGLLELTAEQIKRPEIERRLVQHSSGLQLLLAPQIGSEHELTEGHAEKILEVLSARADYLILDLPYLRGEAMRRTMELSDQVLLVTEPESLSVQCARGQIEQLKAWDVFDRVNLVIVTRIQSASWLNRVEVENRLGMGGGEALAASRWEARALEVDVRIRQGVAAVIQPAPELFHEAIRSGVPIVLIEPSAPAARSLLDLANWLLGKDAPPAEEDDEPVRYIK
jgi:CheY-like chemotaxis protein